MKFNIWKKEEEFFPYRPFLTLKLPCKCVVLFRFYTHQQLLESLQNFTVRQIFNVVLWSRTKTILCSIAGVRIPRRWEAIGPGSCFDIFGLWRFVFSNSHSIPHNLVQLGKYYFWKLNIWPHVQVSYIQVAISFTKLKVFKF